MSNGFSPSPREIRQQLARILKIKSIRSSERLTNLLTYLAKETLAGHEESLTAQRVGIAMGRPKGWKPEFGTDSTVTTGAANLRSALRAHYAREGSGDRVVVTLPTAKEGNRPRGHQRYALTFRYAGGLTFSDEFSPELNARLAKIMTLLMHRTWAGDKEAERIIPTTEEFKSDEERHIHAIDSFVRLVPTHARPIPRKNFTQLRSWLSKGNQPGIWHADFAMAILLAHHHHWQASLDHFESARERSHGQSLDFWWHTAALVGSPEGPTARIDEATALLRARVKEHSYFVAPQIDLAILHVLNRDFKAAANRLKKLRPLLTKADPTRHYFAFARAMYFDAGNSPAKALVAIRDIYLKSETRRRTVYGYTRYLASRINDRLDLEQYPYEERHEFPSPFAQALVRLGSGGENAFDETVEHLHQAIFEHFDPLGMWIGVLPCFNLLHDHDGFRWLCRQRLRPLPLLQSV